MKYLFDSNIIIYFLGGVSLSDQALQRLDVICSESHPISIITKLELLGFNFSSEKNENETKEFVRTSLVHPITTAVEEETIQIRKVVKIKLADAIIAATAITNNLTLLTRNVIDFEGVDGLKIENPFEW